jgi:hypothetical protein
LVSLEIGRHLVLDDTDNPLFRAEGKCERAVSEDPSSVAKPAGKVRLGLTHLRLQSMHGSERVTARN